MKRFFAIIVALSVVTACNNASENSIGTDTTVTAPAATDSISGNSDSVGTATSTSVDSAVQN